MNDATAPVLALDGPSGTGKGTIGRMLSAELGWHYLDSGAIYRVFGVMANEKGLLPEQVDLLDAYARSLKISFEPGEDDIVIYCDGVDRTAEIRTETAGTLASRFGAVPEVRGILLDLQRRQARWPGLVADGRDMGTVVFPEATLKIFLTASAEARLERRHKQLRAKGFDVNLARLRQEMAERDQRDASRKSAPMVAAEDATVIDTSDMSIAEVAESVRSNLKVRLVELDSN